MRHLITRFIPLPIKLKLALLKPYLTIYQTNKSLIRNIKSQVVYLLDSPTHSNLGDHAIAFAQRNFIKKSLPDAQIIEIPIQWVDMHLKYIRKHIKPDDIICMIGGGNFGDEYLLHEYSKRKVCQMFPEHKIIVFPQTIYYSDSERGRRELAETQVALNKHEHLTIAVRDQVSWERAQKYFPCANNILVPDIVLSLNAVSMPVSRNGILCCLRKDLEKNSNFSTDTILATLNKENLAFTLSDTVVGHGVPLENRSDMLTSKWREFCSSELVITDRLHGMIFSCITGTPCIVIDNYNHKIRNFYDTWLTDVSYVSFAEAPEDILPLLEKLSLLPSSTWNSESLTSDYNALQTALL